jgi:transcriptional regulator with XRE-family HTH domain
VRVVAGEIGISPATLSRVERGYMPDIDTFSKICGWLQIDPGEILGGKPKVTQAPMAGVHFRKSQTIAPETAKALAQLIIAVQNNAMVSDATETQ